MFKFKPTPIVSKSNETEEEALVSNSNHLQSSRTTMDEEGGYLKSISRNTLNQTQPGIASEKTATQSQKLIERLIEELDRKSEAIQKIGQDCIILRKTATEQERELKKVREQLEESDMKTKRLISAFDIDIIPAPELRRRYGLLAGKLEVALERLRKANEQLDKYQEIETLKDRTDKENQALRQAHTAQQALVLDLQESLQKAQKFKTVIQKQESVIARLEDALNSSITSTTSHPSLELGQSYQSMSIDERAKTASEKVESPDSSARSVDLNSKSFPVGQKISFKDDIMEEKKPNAYLAAESVSLQLENDSLKSKLSSHQAENQSLRDRIMQLEKNISGYDQIKSERVQGDMPMEMFKLLMRAEAAEIKVNALEEQLIESAKSFGRQIKELKSQNTSK